MIGLGKIAGSVRDFPFVGNYDLAIYVVTKHEMTKFLLKRLNYTMKKFKLALL